MFPCVFEPIMISDRTHRVVLSKDNVSDIIPLSRIQLGILSGYLSNPSGDENFEQLFIRFSGEIIPDRFINAWEQVVQGNEMLRTTFKWENIKNPVQIILKKYRADIRYLDFSDNENKLTQALLQNKKDRLDLNSVPFRVMLYKLGLDRYLMIIAHHHILFDGWSYQVLLNEFINCYNNGAISSSNNYYKVGFKEYLKYINNRFVPGDKKYWDNYLENLQPKGQLLLGLHGDKRINNKKYLIRNIDKDLEGDINTFLKEQKITLGTLIFTAWAILLKKYYNTDTPVFKTTLSNRNIKLKGIENTIGLFINTIPLIFNCSGTLQALIEKTGKMLKELSVFEGFPDDLNKKVDGNCSMHQHFSSILILENYPIDFSHFKESHFTIDSISFKEDTIYDLTLVVTLFQGINLHFSYDPGILSKEETIKISNRFEEIMKSIIVFPQRKVSSISFNEPALTGKNSKNKFVILDNSFEESISGAIGTCYRKLEASYPEDLLFKENAIEYQSCSFFNTGEVIWRRTEYENSLYGLERRECEIDGEVVDLLEVEFFILDQEDISDAFVLPAQKKESVHILVHTNQEVLSEKFFMVFFEKFPLLKNSVKFQISNSRFYLSRNGERYGLLSSYYKTTVESLGDVPDDIQKKLLEIWSGILQIEINRIETNISFGQYGIHSFGASQMAGQINRAFGINLSLSDIFKYPTINELAEKIRKSGQDATMPVKSMCNDQFDVSVLQKGIFISQQISENPTQYNVTNVFIIEGEVDLNRFQISINEVIQRHEILRTTFHLVDDAPKQKVHSSNSIEIEIKTGVDLELEKELKDFVHPFDLEVLPLMRVRIYKNNDIKYLFIDAHHIIMDGYSIAVFINEVCQLYRGKRLSPVNEQYRDYVNSQEQSGRTSSTIEKQKNHWKNKLKGVEIVKLPQQQGFEYNKICFGHTIIKDVKLLSNFCADNNISKASFLLGVFSVLISKVTKSNDLTIGVTYFKPGQYQGIGSSIGMYTDTLPFRISFKDKQDIIQIIDNCNKELTGLISNSDYPGYLIQRDTIVDNGLNTKEIFTAVFNYFFLDTNEKKLDDNVSLQWHEINYVSPKYDIAVYVRDIKAKEISIWVQYNGILFTRYFIDYLLENFKNILDCFFKSPEKVFSDILVAPYVDEDKFFELYKDSY